MDTMKTMLSGRTLVKAPVLKAWSKVDQMIINRASDPILLSLHSKSTFLSTDQNSWHQDNSKVQDP